MPSQDFAARLLNWYDRHGRHDLPWQRDITPYSVWVSEIMLQQTQVKTVIPYYQRFMQRFPDITRLAAAELDEVLRLWTGLGYYARGRNLHKAAKQLVEQHAGQFPTSLQAWIALPGIGRSTAGAILSIALGQRQPILDGNVKRVLSRMYAIAGWPGDSKVAAELWRLADELTPAARVADYTQAIMDLGATVCTRSQPGCERCVLQKRCRAYQQDRVKEFPNAKPKRTKPVRNTQFLICLNAEGEVLLQQRPPTGIWGGLWSFPEASADENLAAYLEREFNLQTIDVAPLAKFRHSFSHYHLDIQPLKIITRPVTHYLAEHAMIRWINSSDVATLGLAAPVKKLLQTLPLET